MPGRPGEVYVGATDITLIVAPTDDPTDLVFFYQDGTITRDSVVVDPLMHAMLSRKYKVNDDG